MRRFACVALLALALAPTAGAAGPWLGTVQGGDGTAGLAANVRYVTLAQRSRTTVTAVRRSDGRVLRSTSVPGEWGVPYVTLNAGVGGLSADGRVLALAEKFEPTGALRTTSRFLVLSTKPLHVQRTIRLHGDFGFDALSPGGRTLYLIQHVSAADITRYRVRAYDLRTGTLLDRAVADKRQEGWDMVGYPVARATSLDGRWIYTLYTSGGNYPFVHALDSVGRTAVCIGLPWNWVGAGDAIMRSDLLIVGPALEIAGDRGRGPRFAIDTKTFEVSKLSG
jgi:hypothetical protein